MIAVTFVAGDGIAATVTTDPGESVMQAALDNDIAGIFGDCGGALACATCHVHVAPDWWARVGPPDAAERRMLAVAIDPDATSRLSCQIRLDAALDGIVVRIPATQF